MCFTKDIEKRLDVFLSIGKLVDDCHILRYVFQSSSLCVYKMCFTNGVEISLMYFYSLKNNNELSRYKMHFSKFISIRIENVL